MKNIKFLISVFIVCCLASCEMGDFDDLNDNPNATTTPLTSYLLTNSLMSVPGSITATQGQLYVQYLANSQYTSADNYQTVRYSYNGWYNGPLADLDLIIKLNTDEATKTSALAYGSNANQIAVAKILMSYYYLHITDRWGDVPYSEALKGDEELFRPKFDAQEEIYNDIFATIKAANAMIDNGAAVEGDILFGGDMQRWKQFGNTIRLVAALRLSNANPSKGQSEFQSAISDGVIMDNSENIMFTHLAEEASDNPWFDRFETRKDYTVAKPLVDYMQSTGNGGMMDVAMDPRLPVYADGTEGSQGADFVGMPYGLSEAQAGDIANTVVSFLGSSLRQQESVTYVYTAAQVLFSMAEAAQMGWISGSAEDYYNEAIMASLDQYGVIAGYDSYIQNSEVAFDSNRALEQIGTQKWVALYLNGYEAWAEWRRTGFPALAPAAAAQNESGQIPVREAYPTTARDNNGDNYEAVVARQGADGLDTKVWWDK